MEIINARYEILGECATNMSEALTQIEFAGRTAYQSQDKITADSAVKFCKMITKRGHHSVLEHSNIVVSQKGDLKPLDAFPTTTQLPFHMIRQTLNKRYISGNIRAWIDYLCDPLKPIPLELSGLLHNYLLPIRTTPTTYPKIENPRYEIIIDHNEIPRAMKRIMIKFIVPRGLSHELVRHRQRIGITQESTRYVRYQNLHVIQPPGLTGQQVYLWEETMLFAELTYSKLLDTGCSPQIARSVLPIATKAEIVITADIEEWNHIFKLRCSSGAHPEMRAIMVPLQNDFIVNGWV